MRIGKGKGTAPFMANGVSGEDGASAETTGRSACKRRKATVAVGVVAAVAIAAGAGFLVWHEQPSFCNAICHTPMDPYLPTYEAEPGGEAVDKWGNEVKNASSMMAPVHRADADATCLSCHVPTMSEQVSEGVSWAAGGYSVEANDTYEGGVLAERSLSDLTAARGVTGKEFCSNDDCHNVANKEFAGLTAQYERNPHDFQHGEVECGECHKAHRASVLYCTGCHGDAELPEGWITASESKRLS